MFKRTEWKECRDIIHQTDSSANLQRHAGVRPTLTLGQLTGWNESEQVSSPFSKLYFALYSLLDYINAEPESLQYWLILFVESIKT